MNSAWISIITTDDDDKPKNNDSSELINSIKYLIWFVINTIDCNKDFVFNFYWDITSNNNLGKVNLCYATKYTFSEFTI